MDRKEWERLPEESTPAWEAFQTYRDLGLQRSIREVARTLDKSVGLIGRWSSQHDWVDRAAAWDFEQDRIRQKEQAEEVQKMARRHAQQAQLGLTAVSRIFGEFLRRIQAEESDPENDGLAFLSQMDPSELSSVMLQAARVTKSLQGAERQARGLPELWLMISGMDDEQLEAFTTALLAEGQAGSAGGGIDGDEAAGLTDALADLREDGE